MAGQRVWRPAKLDLLTDYVLDLQASVCILCILSRAGIISLKKDTSGSATLLQ